MGVCGLTKGVNEVMSNIGGAIAERKGKTRSKEKSKLLVYEE